MYNYRNDDEYEDLKNGKTDTFTRVYVPLNHYFNTMSFTERKSRLIREDPDFQVKYSIIKTPYSCNYSICVTICFDTYFQHKQLSRCAYVITFRKPYIFTNLLMHPPPLSPQNQDGSRLEITG